MYKYLVQPRRSRILNLVADLAILLKPPSVTPEHPVSLKSSICQEPPANVAVHCMNVYISEYLYECIYAFMYICISTHIHTYTHTHTHTYIYIYIDR